MMFGYVQMKRKILILEDLQGARERLADMVKRCAGYVEVYAFADVGDAYACAMEEQIDLFLIDIILKPKNPGDFSGIQFAENIRAQERYTRAEIVFVTTLIGLEAKLLRKIHCFDYIEKPIQEERVQKVVTQALKKINGQEREEEVIFLRKDRVSYPVYTEEIIYVESRNRVLCIYKEKDTLEIPNLTLNRFLIQIRTQTFLVASRGIAVNLRHVEYVDAVNQLVKMRGRGELIEIGGRMKSRFLTEYREAGKKA